MKTMNREQKQEAFSNISATLEIMENDVPEGWKLSVVAAKILDDGRLDAMVVTNADSDLMYASLKGIVVSMETGNIL